MNINNLNELPEWNDDKNTDEGESWKTKATTEACKALYEKWNEVVTMLAGALGTMLSTCTLLKTAFHWS